MYYKINWIRIAVNVSIIPAEELKGYRVAELEVRAQVT